MGKNSVLNSLGRCVGNVAFHKMLLICTNKPESKKHLSDEIRDYGENVNEKAAEFVWNEEEKLEIKDKAVKRVISLIQNYPDVVFDKSKIEIFVEETMKESF
jgi:hypothetical protein